MGLFDQKTTGRCKRKACTEPPTVAIIVQAKQVHKGRTVGGQGSTVSRRRAFCELHAEELMQSLWKVLDS